MAGEIEREEREAREERGEREEREEREDGLGERGRALADAARPHVEPGETLLLRRSGDEVSVYRAPAGEPRPHSPLLQTEPRLYGALMSINDRVAAAGGCLPPVVSMIGALVVCFALEKQALHGLFPEARAQALLDGLASWWFYGIVALSAFAAWMRLMSLAEDRAYAEERARLGGLLARHRIDPYELLTKLEGDDALQAIARRMKHDRRLDELCG